MGKLLCKEIAGDIERKLIKQKFASFGKIKVKKNRVDEDLKRIYDIKSSKLEIGSEVDDVEKEISQNAKGGY